MADLTVSANVDTLLQAADFATFRTSLGLTTLSTTTPGANVATMLATFSSANIIAACSDETGTGSLVFNTSPVFVTPTLGAATATTLNGVTVTSGTGTITLGTKTLVISNSITLAGTDATTMTFPTTSATLARTDAGQTFTGVSIISAWTGTCKSLVTVATVPFLQQNYAAI